MKKALNFIVLFCQKLILTLVFSNVYVALFAVFSAFCFLVAPDINDELWFLVIFGVLTAIISILIGSIRYVNDKKRKKFLSDFSLKPSILKHIIYIIKSVNFITEILAFVPICYIATSIISMGRHSNFINSLKPDLANLVLTAVSLIIFIIIDVLIWFFVQNNWLKKPLL